MKNEKNAKINVKNSKKPSIFKRIVFILLFIILSPVMIITAIISYFIKKKKRKKWEKEGLRDKILILRTTIRDIDKMENYELERYFKTLFFYDGYKVLEHEHDKEETSFLINKNSENIVVAFQKKKRNVRKKNINRLVKLMHAYKVKNAFFITNSSFSSEAKIIADNFNIFLMNREKLISEYERIKSKLKENSTKEEFVDKFDKNIQDKFPNMI